MGRIIAVLLVLGVWCTGCSKDNSTDSSAHPQVLAITPANVSAGQTDARLTIGGTNFSAPVQVTSPPEITVRKINLKSSTELILRLDVSSSAKTGFHEIHFAFPNGTVKTNKLLQVQENKVPAAAFSVSPNTGNSQTEFTFDASASSDPEGNLSSFSWDFGDGTAGQGNIVKHTYASGGSYTVALTVKDGSGAVASATKNVPVEFTRAPVAHMNVSPRTGDTQTEFTFDGVTSTDSDGRIVGYQWDFGNGATAEGSTVRQRFATSGMQNVRLVVTDNDGLQGSIEKSVEVFGRPPVAVAQVNPAFGDTQTIFRFDGTGSYDPDGTLSAFNWLFSDGTTSAAQTVDKTFPAEGSYTATLTVTDSGGMQGQANASVRVGAGPGERCTIPVGRRAAPIFGRLIDYDQEGKTATVEFYDSHTCATAWFNCGDLRKTTPERFYGIMRGMESLGNNRFRIQVECPVTWPPIQIGEEIVIVWRKCEENHCPDKHK